MWIFRARYAMITLSYYGFLRSEGIQEEVFYEPINSSKFLAFVLALVMVFSMLPVSALAAEETVTYTKVTKALDDWTGEYLLVYEEQGFALERGRNTHSENGQNTCRNSYETLRRAART